MTYQKSNDYADNTQENKEKFFTKAGWLNDYALCCGYMEEIEFTNGYDLTLYKLNGAYIVSLYNNHTKTRDSYYAAPTLSEARHNFITLRRNISTGLIKPT